MTSVSSQWIPEDDLLLKNSIEAGASLEALAKGAVKFSRRFTFRELRDRWYSLLYDPEVAAQASARMAELEVSGTNPSSKSRLDNMKGGDKVPEKRKSIRRHYHAMRKRIKNELFSSPNLGFFEERNLHNYNHQEHKFQDHVINNHEAHGGDAVLDLGFEEKDFEILRQAFPESIGTVATTTTPNIVDNPANAFHNDGCHKSVENNFLNGSRREEGGLYKFTQDVSPSRNKLMGSFDSNNEIKNGTCAEETGPSATPPIEKLPKTDKSAGFGGKQHFHSPVSDGSASFHTLGFSSPSTRLPLWKTLEDVSAPDMPVDENNAESHQVREETLALSEDCDQIRETKGSPGFDGPHQESHLGSSPTGFNNTGGVQEGEYTDSLLNFSNEDDILFMDTDVKDTMHDISNPLLLDSPKNVQDVDLCRADATPSLAASSNLAIPSIQCREEQKDSSVHSDQHNVCYQEFDVPSTSVSQSDSLQLTEGKIICTLNREDPDIPCNDDIFLLIHPSSQFASTVGLQNAIDSIDPLSSSLREKDSEQGLVTVRKGKEPAPSFMRSHTVGSKALPEFVKSHPLVGCAFKRESPDGEYMVPLPGKPNNIRIPSQTRPMHVALESRGNGMLEEDVGKVEFRGLGSPAMYNQMPLPVEVGPVTMIDPESVDDSYIDDHNNSDSDGDIPYFSDVEAMILEMDLVDAQESCITSEVARYQNESAKRMIMRLEQAARSSFQRAMSSHGALAIFYGRRLKHYIRKAEVTIGRSTDDTEVDIDLRKEGRANKISRRQAIIKLEADGSFSLKNLGASSISLNGKEVAHGQVVALGSSCLIEIRGMSFVFEINDKYVRRFLENQPI
ncbi:SMAD/FHA domain, Microspherule protein domain protein [Artemisia annua]|uniref:SMAD/FHA domain, Microspherule protein domain protein n=1 Tax=Artemisia annua TaxID=35608 RepID=A0A2U1MM47_ARTAN|nr:SMAD/FHA domain, Microspherule protein domain protein [Artemisia annua]